MANRKANRGSFGKNGRKGGRPKGVPNKATGAVKALASAFLTEHYWPELERRWKAKKVQHPEIKMLFEYGYGKPKELHEVTGPDGGPVQVVTRIERVIVNGTDAED